MAEVEAAVVNSKEGISIRIRVTQGAVKEEGMQIIRVANNREAVMEEISMKIVILTALAVTAPVVIPVPVTVTVKVITITLGIVGDGEHRMTVVITTGVTIAPGVISKIQNGLKCMIRISRTELVMLISMYKRISTISSTIEGGIEGKGVGNLTIIGGEGIIIEVLFNNTDSKKNSTFLVINIFIYL